MQMTEGSIWFSSAEWDGEVGGLVFTGQTRDRERERERDHDRPGMSA